MNKIFIYANRHSNDHRCYYNNLDRFLSLSQPTNTQHQHRIQIDVSKNYTGKEFRIIEHKKTL